MLAFVIVLRASDGDVTVAVRRLGHLGFVGLGLLVALVVVLTMLTQAFEFEGIRILEGYWTPYPGVGWLGDFLAWVHRWRFRRLETI